MNWINSLNAKNRQTSFYNLDSGESCVLPQQEGHMTRLEFITESNRYAYIRTGKYTLRDDLAQKLNYRFYKFDLQTGERWEIFENWDRTGIQINTVLPLEKRRFAVVASVPDSKENTLYQVDETGRDRKILWQTSAYPYWFSCNPNNSQFAFHMAHYDLVSNPKGVYGMNLMELDGTRKLICSEEGHLFFGPTWSTDGKYLAFSDCVPADTPGHHFANVLVYDTEKEKLQTVTNGYPQYFATAHGLEKYRMFGSNRISWLDNAHLIISKMAPGSHPDVRFDGSQRSHEELIHDPAMGRGYCNLVLLNIHNGQETYLTNAEEGQWNFRPGVKDGRYIVYTRSCFGQAPEIRLYDMQTREDKLVTKGMDELGADYADFCQVDPRDLCRIYDSF